MVLIIYTQSLLQWLCQVNLCDQKEYDVPPPRANEKTGKWICRNRVLFHGKSSSFWNWICPKGSFISAKIRNETKFCKSRSFWTGFFEMWSYFRKLRYWTRFQKIQIILNWIYRNRVDSKTINSMRFLFMDAGMSSWAGGNRVIPGLGKRFAW